MIRKLASMQGVEVVMFVLLFVVIVAQSVYLVTYVRAQREVQDQLVCQSQVNTAFREALTVRTESAGRERDAQRKLLTALSEPPSREQFQRAYEDYFTALDQADRDRDANPLPDFDC